MVTRKSSSVRSILSTRAAFTALCALALVAAAASIAFAAGPPVVPISNRHFDHERHAASAAAKGKPAECTACHDDNKPKKEHARCAGCHTYTASCSVMKTPGPGGPARLCRSCHTPTQRACLPNDLPPLPATNNFTPKFTHTKHLGFGAAIEQDCGLCHKAEVINPTSQKPHAMCSGCHNPNGSKPAMTDCAGCHVTPTKPTTGPGSTGPDPFKLNGFDHRAHANASQQSVCTSCHDKPAGDVPKPSMLGCQTRCHDGQKAFSATGTHCTMCHRGSTPPTQARTDLPFSHAEHAKRNVKMDNCTACHVLDTDGTLAAPLSRKDHQPCANSGCHQTEYLTRQPKICGICHDATAPWAKAAARPEKRPGIEWFESMNHASHAGAMKASCESCHGDKRTGGAAPQGHRACASCHKSQAPTMTDCQGCHKHDKLSKVTTSQWNVSATFEHTKHATDPRSHRATQCVECHKQVINAKDMASISAPKMADCDGCHDGKIEFKTTGFGCVRCHGSKAAAAASSAMLTPMIPAAPPAPVAPPAPLAPKTALLEPMPVQRSF